MSNSYTTVTKLVKKLQAVKHTALMSCFSHFSKVNFRINVMLLQNNQVKNKEE